MFRKFISMIKGQRGFTLPEMLVGLAIIGGITGVVTMSIVLTMHLTTGSRNQVSALAQTQNARFWIQRDVKMAQVVSPASPSATGLPLVLRWADWDSNVESQVIYDVVDETLARRLLIDGVNSGTTMIAMSVVEGAPSTTCRFIDTDDDDIRDLVLFTLTITEGAGREEVSETRVLEINPRPIQG